MDESTNTSRRTFIKNAVGTTAVLSLPALLSTQAHGSQQPAGTPLPRKRKGLTLDFNFENGNLGPHRIDGNVISIGPISRHKDTWFSFRIKGAKHQKVTMVLEWTNTRRVTSNFDGQGNNTAMITYDGRGYEIVKDVKFELKDPANDSGNFIQTIHHTFREDEAHIVYTAPWSNTDLEALARKLEKDPRVETGNIGISKFRNLPITYFKITDKSVSDENKKKLFLIAREDSYETGGSWGVDGIMRFILSDDPVAKEILKKMVFVVFPIFSVDGVAMGATNFPLNDDNTNFVYVTSQWNQEPERDYHETRLMKDFWDRMKSEGFHPDIAFKFHATCYWACHFRPEDCAEENLESEMKLLGILREKLSWRQQDPPLRNPAGYMNANFIKVFPNAITYSSHNDFLFTRGYLKSDKLVYRRHEDVLQDGELMARSFGEFYGIPSDTVAPYLMAGDVDINNGKKGTPLIYSVYYFDVNHLPPESVEVIINKKPFKMTAVPNADYSRPVKFTFETTLKDAKNEYNFRASNGKKSRVVPEEDYLLPGPFIV